MTEFDAKWQQHEMVNFGNQKVKGQDHMRTKWFTIIPFSEISQELSDDFQQKHARCI